MGSQHTMIEPRGSVRIDYTSIGQTISSCFQQAAELHPHRTAISCRLGEITYAELNAGAKRLAQGIISSGGDIGDRIALLMPQDRRIFLAMIAALKVGRIVLILNVQDPEARTRQLLKDAEVTNILTIDDYLQQAQLLAPSTPVISIDQALDASPAHAPEPELGADDTAFIVYTSGSTGYPKGVMQTHGHTLRDAYDVKQAANISPEDKVLLVASLWGAQALSTTWLTLLNGATLVSFPAAEHGVTRLAEKIVEQNVSVFISASSLFRHFVKVLDGSACLPSVRMVKLSADAATREDLEAARRFCPAASLMHAMGCSETGHLVYKLFSRDAVVEAGALPLERPFDGVNLRIVDEEGRDRPLGEVGTISANIRYLAAGYWRDPLLTEQCFFEGPNGTLVFRGGDLAFFDENRQLRLSGRKDTTYKIRGQRVDLGEVERGLLSLSGVADAAVVVTPVSGESRLIAHVVPHKGYSLSSINLRNSARAVLARHLLPSLFVITDSLPRSANGKVDRTELRGRVPASPYENRTRSRANRTVSEPFMVTLWKEAFDLDYIGSSEHFFELGGDSLTAAVIGARLHESFGVSVNFDAFVAHPVLEDFAAFVDKMREKVGLRTTSPVVRTVRNEPAPASAVQHHYWFSSIAPSHSVRHTRAAAARIEGSLNLHALQNSLDEVVARHDTLRTRFEKRDTVIRQIVEPPAPVSMALIDVSSESDAEARAEALLDEEGQRRFDLSAGPPISFKLVRVRSDCHDLVQSSHHIISDGPSWGIFLRDLAQSYQGQMRGPSGKLPALFCQYADYAIWERERWLQGSSRLRQEVEWWRQELKTVASYESRLWEPYMRGEPAQKLTPDDWTIRWGLDGQTSQDLDRLGRELNTTYYALRLATVVPVLASACRTNKVLVNAALTTRCYAEFQNVFGPFVEAVPLPLYCERNWSFRELAVRTRDRLLDVRRHAVPYKLLWDSLADEGVVVPRPLLWIHMPTIIPAVSSADLKLTWRNTRWYPMQKATTLNFDHRREQDGCHFRFDGRLYASVLMRGFLDCLIDFIGNAAREPDASLSMLLNRNGIGERLQNNRA